MLEAIHFQYFLGGLVSLLVITNPLSKLPLFVSLTQGMSEERRRQQANWAGIYAGIIMAVSLVGGNMLLAFFGISYGAMRISGGLVVAAIGYQMLFAEQGAHRATRQGRLRLLPDCHAGHRRPRYDRRRDRLLH